MMLRVDETRLYNGQFSPDGSLYYESSQAFYSVLNSL